MKARAEEGRAELEGNFADSEASEKYEQEEKAIVKAELHSSAV